MKSTRTRLLALLCILCLIPVAAPRACAEAEDPRPLPILLTEARYEALKDRVRNSEDSRTRRMLSVLTNDYAPNTVGELLQLPYFTCMYAGLAMLRATVPDELLEEAILLERHVLLHGCDGVADLLAGELSALREACAVRCYCRYDITKEQENTLRRVLYGDERLAGIGYTEEEAAADCALNPDLSAPFMTLLDGTAALLRYPDTTAAEAEVPAEYEGRPVSLIGWFAFENCGGLTRISIPASVTDIGDGAFGNCPNLGFLDIPMNHPTLYLDIGALIHRPDRRLIWFNPRAVSDEYTVPDGILTIAPYAFTWSGCRTVEIPDSVTRIGRNAFAASSLQRVTLPGGLTELEEDTFYNCPLLTEVTLPEGLTAIGSWAFGECPSLTSLRIPGSVTAIGEHAFDLTDENGETVPNPNLVLAVAPGSAAEEYCLQHGIRYLVEP